MTTSRPARPVTSVTVLRDRRARLFLTAVVVSGFGTSAMWLTSGVWVKDLTGSDTLAALCTCALWLPTLLGPALGVLADRFPRRALLVTVNFATALLLPSLLLVDDERGVWLLLTVLVLYGAGGVLEDAAQGALVAGTVDARLLGGFNGLRMTANEGMKLLAPLAGAGLYAARGGAWVVLLDAATFALAGCLYLRLRPVAAPAPQERGARGGTVRGLRFLWRSPALRPLVLTGGAVMALSGLSSSAQYGVVEGLGHPPSYLGLLYAVQGAGSVLVGLAAGRLLDRLGPVRLAAAGVAVFAVAVALRALPWDPVVLLSSFLVGAGLPCPLVAAATAVQRGTPGHLLGRVTATTGTAMFAPNALSLGLGAGLVAFLDPRAQVAGCGAVGCAVAVLLLRSGAGRATAAATAAAGESGP